MNLKEAKEWRGNRLVCLNDKSAEVIDWLIDEVERLTKHNDDLRKCGPSCAENVTLRAEVERLTEKLAGEQESGAALVTLNNGLLSLNRKYLAEVEKLRGFLGSPSGSTAYLSAEVERLTAENANLRANMRGRTMYHSDADVNREMGLLREKVDRLLAEAVRP